LTKVIFAFPNFATAPNNGNDDEDDDDDDRRRKMKFYSSTSHCKLPYNQLIFQRKIDTNNPLKNIVTIEHFWKGTYIYSIGTLNMAQEQIGLLSIGNYFFLRGTVKSLMICTSLQISVV
jgi:hypothetical protein